MESNTQNFGAQHATLAYLRSYDVYNNLKTSVSLYMWALNENRKTCERELYKPTNLTGTIISSRKANISIQALGPQYYGFV